MLARKPRIGHLYDTHVYTVYIQSSKQVACSSSANHGVGVITKLHFVIFAAFKQSMTLDLAQRSFKVIHFRRNRKPMSILYRLFIAILALYLSVSGILTVLYAHSQLCK